MKGGMLVAPFSKTEIIVFGGYDWKNKNSNDVYVLKTSDSLNMTLKKVLNSSLKDRIYANGNQCCMVRHGQLTGLVERNDQNAYFIYKYTLKLFRGI